MPEIMPDYLEFDEGDTIFNPVEKFQVGDRVYLFSMLSPIHIGTVIGYDDDYNHCCRVQFDDEMSKIYGYKEHLLVHADEVLYNLDFQDKIQDRIK